MAFNQRKEKEIAMARMTLHSSTTTNQSVCVCMWGGWVVGVHKSKNTNRGGIAYQAKGRYGRPVFEVCHSLQVYNTVHGTIAAVREDLYQAKEGGFQKAMVLTETMEAQDIITRVAKAP